MNIDYTIKSIKNSIKNNILELETVEKSIKQTDFETASDGVEKTLYSFEKSIVNLRELLYLINMNFPEQIEQYFEESAEVLNIKVEQVNELFKTYKISIPFLLPNRRNSWTLYKNTIGQTIIHSVRKYCKENKVVPIKKCSVVFLTYYSSLHKKFISDNDNKEISDTLNCLIDKFISNDKGIDCDIHILSRETRYDTRSLIYITERDNFINLYNHILLNSNEI